MKTPLFILSTIFCLLAGSCKNKEDSQPQPEADYTSIDIVTGMDFFDDNGNPIGRWKSPNHNPGNSFAFPNPNTGTVSIYSQENIIRIWLLPADCLTDSVTINIPELSEDLNYEIEELENAQIKDISIPNFNNQITLDFSDVAAGFYRVFYEIELGEVFWQNLYIDPTVTNIPTFDFLDDLCD